MAYDFRQAFVRHMDQNGTKLAELVRETGVSRDVLNKLLAREKSSTTVENAMLIAAFYGKSVNQFISGVEATDESRIAALYGLLEPEERRIVEAQIRGLVAASERRSSEPSSS